jgi:hypothetical protein
MSGREARGWRFITPDIGEAAANGQLDRLAEHYDVPKRTGGWSGVLVMLAFRERRKRHDERS